MYSALFLILFTISCALNAQSEYYEELHREIEADLVSAQRMEQSRYFTPYTDEARQMAQCLQKADAMDIEADRRLYLKQLRRCAKAAEAFDVHYVAALREAVAKDDRELFRRLIEADPRILRRDVWVQKSVAYYKESRLAAPFDAGERLLRSDEEEQGYRRMAAMEMANYEADVKVLSYEQARYARDKNGKLRTFFLAYAHRNGETVLIAENNNPYPVTLLVRLDKLQNYTADRALPYHTEIDPFSKREVMRLHRKEEGKKAYFSSQYSWVMGRASARHDNSFIYGLPFRRNSTVIVSQGFNGEHTHSGKSRYAVDFAADTGTRVYAARGGKVIATEDSFDKGGFGIEFAKYANYVTIEHSDGTMGQYYHLRKNGVAVNVGQQILKGQFIGLSGNTGYSSGPHLHFGVYKVDNDYRSTVTLPFQFKTDAGVVDSPAKGDLFKAVR